ncbi:protein kinase [Streptomyces sp. H10-C2]|uniref:serine/threonine-protein kinase n=1 Tax=unclassified Streptomyces TaxID=2593676 RepID=UPI0024BA53B2|nr:MULTISPECIES: serine/threonine-protein kinase [unclassified Streptomyces]MDJ0341971.1 protein kinase [Streptomyces sp. PH10-H1]MDJ0369944.1 protein kinase [Streptomyces sp. H10-C2]MDJ0370055.1 protein kinase [Streptomyces sp. H10-C2]
MQPLTTTDPSSIGPYRLLGRLGAGGMGRVFLGRSPGGRTVAVKVVRSELAEDTEFRTRFRREVDAARLVGAAWSAPVLDADTESPVPWIATGYIAGPTLADAVSEFGPLPASSVRTLGAGLAEALDAVHRLGLLHRDIKPSNVMLSLDGPVLIDFGVARAMDASGASVTGSGVVVGSPGYMSPEQVLARPLGAASDVFALGAVLAFAATGHGPFSGDSAASLLYKVAHEEPELDGLPEELRDVVESCLAKAPAVRPTPARLAARLAPDGAAALVRQGWLSTPLMAQLGRRVVELLDLEAGPLPALPTGSASYSAPGSGSATGSASGYVATAAGALSGKARGLFGPPPAPLASAGAERSAGPHDAVPESGPGSAPGSAPESVPEPPVRRGRRRLLAGVVVLIAAVAATLVVVLQPHDKPDGTTAGKATVSPTGSATVSPTGRPTGAVPAAFIGTWQGNTVSTNGVPNGLLTVIIKAGRVGENVGESNVNLLGVLNCGGTWKLVTATTDVLVFDSTAGDPGATSGCSKGATAERLTLKDAATVTYTTNDSAAGRPSGDLKKIK